MAKKVCCSLGQLLNEYIPEQAQALLDLKWLQTHQIVSIHCCLENQISKLPCLTHLTTATQDPLVSLKTIAHPRLQKCQWYSHRTHDVRPLQVCRHLTHLTLGEFTNTSSDWKPLSMLPLKHLCVHECWTWPQRSIMAQWTRLEHLHLGSKNNDTTRYFDFSWLSTMVQLKTLILPNVTSGTQLAIVHALKELVHLEIPHFNDSLDPLMDKQLKTLNIRYHRSGNDDLEAIVAIWKHCDFTTLELCGDMAFIDDWTPLKTLRLHQLIITFAMIDSLVLSHSDRPLHHVELTWFTGTDLTPLSTLKQLTFLKLTHFCGTDLRPLRGLPLTYLDLSEFAGVDVRPLCGAPLQRLDFSHCSKEQARQMHLEGIAESYRSLFVCVDHTWYEQGTKRLTF